MADRLDMDYINNLPQPLFAREWETWWPVYDIDVETGLMRLDVCGKLDVTHVDRVVAIRDDSGKEHDPADFYLGAERGGE